MRKFVVWLFLVVGGIILGGAVGASAGWYVGTLRLREYPEFLAGESLSEDTVPRGLYMLGGGPIGGLWGYILGVGIMLDEGRRNANHPGDAAALDQSSIRLFD